MENEIAWYRTLDSFTKALAELESIKPFHTMNEKYDRASREENEKHRNRRIEDLQSTCKLATNVKYETYEEKLKDHFH